MRNFVKTENDMATTETRMAVIDSIMSRVSVRHFTGEAVSEKDVETILRAAMAAPSAGNKQPWRFVVVTDKNALESIGNEVVSWAPAKRAPLAIIVCGDTDCVFPGEGKDYWIEDTSAAAENILLAAHALNLGAVWLGCYPLSERTGFISSLLGLPANIVPMGILAIGHPESAIPAKDKFRPDNVHHNHW